MSYDLMFTPDFLDKTELASDDFSLIGNSFLFYSLIPDEPNFKERFNLIPNCGYDIGSTFGKIYTEYRSAKTGYLNLMRLYLAEIIIKLFRKIQSFESNNLSDTQKNLVQSVMKYIEENYNMKIKVDEIASQMFFSKNYLYKIFKQETGQSIRSFLSEIRIKVACKLLTTTQDNIIDIAIECGFSDMKSFYLIFKKYTGITPKQYRERAGCSI